MAWTPQQLAELRRRYAEAGGGDIHDPRFRRVADRIFSGGTRAAPYAGVPTFLDAPYRQVDPQAPDFGDLQVALVGMPMDLGVTNRPGSRFGPRAVRAIERVGPKTLPAVMLGLVPSICSDCRSSTRGRG